MRLTKQLAAPAWSGVLAGLLVSVASAAIAAPAAPAAPAKWQSMTLTEIAAVGTRLRTEGAGQQRRLLAAYVAQRYTAARASGKVDFGQWLPVIDVAGEFFAGRLQEQVFADLRRQLFPDTAAIVGRSAERMRWLCVALMRLGRSVEGGSMAAAWVAGSDRYKQATPEQLYYVLFPLMRTEKPVPKARQTAWSQIVEHLTAEYFGSPAKLRAQGCPAGHPAVGVGRSRQPGVPSARLRTIWAATTTTRPA